MKYNKQTVKKIFLQYRSGVSAKTIAANLSMPVTSVYGCLKRAKKRRLRATGLVSVQSMAGQTETSNPQLEDVILEILSMRHADQGQKARMIGLIVEAR